MPWCVVGCGWEEVKAERDVWEEEDEDGKRGASGVGDDMGGSGDVRRFLAGFLVFKDLQRNGWTYAAEAWFARGIGLSI